MTRQFRTSILLLGFFVAMLMAGGCGDKKGGTTTPSPYEQVDLTAVEANALIETSTQVVIIDVSSLAEYWDIHIDGALNYPLIDGDFERIIPTLDKQAIYLIYSRSDLSSQTAADDMVAAGFSNVHRLAESLSIWINEGYPVYAPEPT